MVVGLADLDGPVARQILTAVQRRAWDKNVAGPGKGEATPDQNLAAIGGDDPARAATKRQAAQGVASVIVGRGGGRLGQSIQKAGIEVLSRGGRRG